MELILRRSRGIASTPGTLTIDGVWFGYTLEPVKPISAGRYEVKLTVSGRAKQGTLWSPSPDNLLPELLNVPGFTAIRIHAGNDVTNTLGCILIAYDRHGETILTSRPALRTFMARFKEPCFITVKEAT